MATALLTSTLMAGCSHGDHERASDGAEPSGTATGSASPSPTRPPSGDAGSPRPRSSVTSPGGVPSPHPDRLARRVLDGLTMPQQVGQLLMVGIPAAGSSPQVLDELASRHVGNIFLLGRSANGIRATRTVVLAAQRVLGRDNAEVPLLVATDQEGGAVQVLTGPGFSTIPSGRVQGSRSPAVLQRSARRWGHELRSAGVNLDLAPVADVVPSSPDPRSNGPVGHFDRQLGATPAAVLPHALALTRGMADAHVGTAVKHFPGLGHVRDNTDTSTSVVDTVVGRHDPGLAVFAAAAHAGTTMVMVSTAVYQKLDQSLPAAFCPVVVRGLLRGRLGFSGVVVSDDLGAARQVQSWTPGRRAELFVAAGGDLVLTVRADDAAEMAADLLAAAQRSADLRLRIHRAALRVLVFKARLGLLGNG